MIERTGQGPSQTQTFPHLTDTNLEKIVGYDVIDKGDNDLGTVTAIWTDHTGQPAFLGVRTTWLLGKTHVVPAHGAQVNFPREHVRIPYSEEEVKNAPNYDPDDEMDIAHEREVYTYYRTRGPRLPEFSEHTRTETTRTGEARTGQVAGETRIPLHEEELKVGKRSVEMGGVRLRKIIRTETVQQPVEVRREDVVVERVPARERQPAGKAFEGEDVFIPLRREEPVVEKEVHVREEVRARKTAETERETVRGTIRKEDVQMEDQRKEREKR